MTDGARPILDILPDLVLLMEENGTVTYANAAVTRVLGWPADEVVGRSAFDFVHPSERAEALERVAHQIQDGTGTRRHHVAVAHHDGRYSKFELLAARSPETDGRFLLVLRDVSEREAAQRRLHRSDEQLRALTENVPDALGRYDDRARLVFASRRFEELDRDHPDLVRSWRVRATEVRREGSPLELEHDLDGPRWIASRFVPEFGTDGEVTHVLVIATDVTHRKQHELRLVQAAAHDPLTGLANRQRFRQVAERSLARAGTAAGTTPRSPGRLIALLFIDLDGFKEINDSHGHHTGDTVLAAVARQLADVVRPDDLLARFGGDEFVMLCHGLRHSDDASAVAHRVLEALRDPVSVGGGTFTVDASIGLAVAPAEGIELDALIEQADRAMYEAKARGGASISPGAA